MRITDSLMTSDVTPHRAVHVASGEWVLSWLPDRPLTRSQATTGMVLAEAVAAMQEEGRTRVVDHTHPRWPHIDGWAAELGLTGSDAMVRVSEPPQGVFGITCPDCGLPVVETERKRDERHDHCGPLPHTGPVGGPYCDRCG